MRFPYYINALITFLFVFSSLLLSEKILTGNSFSRIIFHLGIKKTGFKKLFPSVLICSILMLTYPAAGFILGVQVKAADDWGLNLAGLFLTGGLSEELLFRGFLFRHLRENMNFKKAVLFSMFVFMMAHLFMFTYMDPVVSVFSTALSVFSSIPFAYLFEQSGNSVWSPVLLHVTIRTIGLVINTDETHFMSLTLIWISASMIIPYIVLVFFREFRQIWKQG